MPPWPPSQQPFPAAPVPTYEPGPSAAFTIGAAFSRGWSMVTTHYTLVLVGPLVLTLASIVGALIPIVGAFAGFAVMPFWSTLLYQCVRVDRGLPVEPLGFFRMSGSTYGWLLLLGLLNAVISIIAGVPLVMVVGVLVVMAGPMHVDPVVVIAIGVTLLAGTLIALLYVSARLLFAPLLFLDAPTGSLDVIAAFRLSWTRTGPFAWSLLGMILLLSLVSLGSTMLLCVGLFLIGLPLTLAVEAAAFNLICPPAGACPTCGYDLRGTPGLPCPECEKPPAPAPDFPSPPLV